MLCLSLHLVTGSRAEEGSSGGGSFSLPVAVLKQPCTGLVVVILDYHSGLVLILDYQF